ncbi:MAG: PSD1 and planctomycete cytochrome C domain-containing protein [Planctomycetota bacterium]
MRGLIANLIVTISACLVVLAASIPAARADDAGIDFFEKKIRPLLVEHCDECHSTNSKKLGGNLLLDSRSGVRKGGDSGAAVEPGQPDKSLLIKAIRYTDDSVKMPPKGRLPAAAIADLEAWVKLGAPDPRDKPPAAKVAASWEEVLRTRRDWWSLHPVQKPVVPRPKDAAWSQQPIDQFVLAKLEENGLTGAVAAEPGLLVRRLSLVLTGLPPSPEQIESFVHECQLAHAVPGQPLPKAAVEKLLDSLLGSPHFGERWARHWLDVVRFTETHGNEWNYEVHHAWRYRDYLIRAFNGDVPYDQFVREHIAGDLLPQPRWNEQDQLRESIIGTAFYRFGEVNHDDCIGLPEIGYDLLDNQIDTLTKAFQATTVACARCHDHKLDAISTHDYYALLGVLRSSRLVAHTIDAPNLNAAKSQRLRELKLELRRELTSNWLRDVGQFPEYMRAAVAKRAVTPEAEALARGLEPQRLEKWNAALIVEKAPLEDPLEPWRQLSASSSSDPASFTAEWRKLAEKYTQQERERAEFNRSQFVTFADFREATPPDGWEIGGNGLDSRMDASSVRSEPDGRGVHPTKSGDFALHHEGDSIVKAVLPAGRFTHALSEKLNGTLRSPVIPLGKKQISFQVMGQRSSAVRLVSNNCQLNYKNYRALTSDGLSWVTFSPPDDRDQLRTYAELMTMFDNPKFPDQLAALGGDPGNYRLPWEQAAANPRSWFGVTQVVLHDGGEPPRPELAHLRRLFAANDAVPKEPTALTEVAARYVSAVEAVIRAWSDDKATDDDVKWLDTLLRRELLGNRLDLSPQVRSLAEQYRQTEAELAVPRVALGVADIGPGSDQTVFVRGDCHRPGESVPRRYLEVLANSRDSFGVPGSGRLELAERIATPANPLTARVMVNRVWHHLFGTGLVRSVDDFGHVGDLPSHPELLDHLATQFVEEGWSIKRLIRSIVLTRTFQQAADQPSPAARVADPQNRLLWHYPARRMEAEAIRDSILATSGRLDRTLFGHSVQPFRETPNVDRRLFPGPVDGGGRRSVYIKNNLMEAPRFLEAFNFPGGKIVQGRRDQTNVPAQALALLNDPFVVQQADVWAAQLIRQPDSTVTTRIESMFLKALGRAPTGDERQRFEAAARQFAELHQVPANDLLTNQPVWKDMAHVIFNAKEFIYIP